MPRIKAVFEIDDIDTLKLLANPIAMAVVEFLGRPLSATELARKLEIPRTRLYHHLNRLRERGIIKVASTRKVGAIEERIYQVVARTYRASAESSGRVSSTVSTKTHPASSWRLRTRRRTPA